MLTRARMIMAVTLLAGCASVQLDPQRVVATTAASFNAKLGLNSVSVPLGSQLVAASVDGKSAFCTVKPAFFAIAEARQVCFTDTGKTGILDHYYVLGTLRSLIYDAHIPYTLGSTTVVAAPPEPMVSAADVAECEYQAQAATVTEPGLIMPAFDAANLRNLCLRAKAARRAEGLR
jgi:hypothetical protein